MVESRLPPAAELVPAHIPYARSAKTLLERCLREALRMGHNYIGTEHLLLAMLVDSDTDPGHTLVQLGVDANATERWITGQLGEG